MRHSLAVLSLILLACNVALANGHALAYCIEKSTGDVCSVSAVRVSDETEKCCPSEQASKLSNAPLASDCDHCTDYQVEASDEEIAPNFERVIVKAAGLVGLVSIDLFDICCELKAVKTLDARAPPLAFPKASQQYAETVQLRI